MFEMKNDSYFEWEKTSYLDRNQLVYFHEMLVCLRSELESKIKRHQGQLNENDVQPIEEIERSTLATDKEIDIQNRARNWDLINKVDKALSKIKNGTYGFCEETDEPIGIERLKANPMSEYCLPVQEQFEKGKQYSGAGAFYRNRFL